MVDQETGKALATGWHVKREIQVGHIITTITIAAATMLYVTKLEQRIALIEQAVIVQRDRDDRQDRMVTESVTLLRNQLDRMEAKLDRTYSLSMSPKTLP